MASISFSALNNQIATGLEATLAPLWPLLFLIGLIASQVFHLDFSPYAPNWLGTRPHDPHLLLIQRVSTLTHFSAYRLGVIVAKLKAKTLPSADGLLMLSSILFGGSEDNRELGWEAMQKLNVTEATADALEEMIKSRWSGGMLARLAGLLNFGSIILIIGSLGVSVALLPAIWPLLVVIYNTLGPLLLLVHQAMLPFYALFCYSFVLYLILLAGQFSKDVAPFMILVAGFLASVVYIGFGLRSDPSKFEDKLPGLLYSFMLITYAFPAVRHQSSLLGFVAVASLFSLLGFIVVPIGCGWLIGWSDPGSMIVTAISAGSLTLILILRKIAGLLPYEGIMNSLPFFDYFFSPFSIGLSIFGSLTLSLAGLIISSRSYREAWALSYAQANAVYLAVLLLYIGLGSMLSDDSFRNCGATFLALYLSQKIFEADIMSIWVSILLASGALVGAGLWLKTHPLFILSLIGATPQIRSIADN